MPKSLPKKHAVAAADEEKRQMKFSILLKINDVIELRQITTKNDDKVTGATVIIRTTTQEQRQEESCHIHVSGVVNQPMYCRILSTLMLI